MSAKYDLVGQITRAETEGLPRDEYIELFQYLVDTGLAWKLQGTYGRTAERLIRAGEVTYNSPNKTQEV